MELLPRKNHVIIELERTKEQSKYIEIVQDRGSLKQRTSQGNILKSNSDKFKEGQRVSYAVYSTEPLKIDGKELMFVNENKISAILK